MEDMAATEGMEDMVVTEVTGVAMADMDTEVMDMELATELATVDMEGARERSYRSNCGHRTHPRLRCSSPRILLRSQPPELRSQPPELRSQPPQIRVQQRLLPLRSPRYCHPRRLFPHQTFYYSLCLPRHCSQVWLFQPRLR